MFVKDQLIATAQLLFWQTTRSINTLAEFYAGMWVLMWHQLVLRSVHSKIQWSWLFQRRLDHLSLGTTFGRTRARVRFRVPPSVGESRPREKHCCVWEVRCGMKCDCSAMSTNRLLIPGHCPTGPLRPHRMLSVSPQWPQQAWIARMFSVKRTAERGTSGWTKLCAPTAKCLSKMQNSQAKSVQPSKRTLQGTREKKMQKKKREKTMSEWGTSFRVMWCVTSWPRKTAADTETGRTDVQNKHRSGSQPYIPGTISLKRCSLLNFTHRVYSIPQPHFILQFVTSTSQFDNLVSVAGWVCCASQVNCSAIESVHPTRTAGTEQILYQPLYRHNSITQGTIPNHPIHQVFLHCFSFLFTSNGTAAYADRHAKEGLKTPKYLIGVYVRASVLVWMCLRVHSPNSKGMNVVTNLRLERFLTWCSKYCIPVFEYFFSSFGCTYSAPTAKVRLHPLFRKEAKQQIDAAIAVKQQHNQNEG